jgi:uncharacterized protein (DUF433 family)
MARAKQQHELDEQRLIEQHIDPNWDRYGGRADARTCDGVPVWALIGHLRLVDGDIDKTATAYELPREEVQAALAYYRRNKKYIDARILLNTA